jgi:7-cyano-7-deazaguanine synthase in queuosine biosynthesis
MEFYRNLILFSGGVESTALLTIAKPQDIILIIDPVFSNVGRSYNKISVQKITNWFNFKPVYATINFSLEPSSNIFVHQMKNFINICSLWVNGDSTIKSIWCGRNSNEPSPDIVPMINHLMTVWKIMHPNVPFEHPLDHLSKYEQLNLIPETVRKYVYSCIYDKKCGTCYKCKEYTWI